MSSPNREKATAEAHRIELSAIPGYPCESMIADALTTAYDERDRLLGQLQVKKDAVFQQLIECEAKLSTALADRDRYKDALDERDQAVKAAREGGIRDLISRIGPIAAMFKGEANTACYHIFEMGRSLLDAPQPPADRQQGLDEGLEMVAQPVNGTATRWEYHYAPGSETEGLGEFLARKGADCWEVCATFETASSRDVIWVFKRPIIGQPSQEGGK